MSTLLTAIAIAAGQIPPAAIVPELHPDPYYSEVADRLATVKKLTPPPPPSTSATQHTVTAVGKRTYPYMGSTCDVYCFQVRIENLARRMRRF